MNLGGLRIACSVMLQGQHGNGSQQSHAIIPGAVVTGIDTVSLHLVVAEVHLDSTSSPDN